MAAFFPIVLATTAAVANIPSVYFRVARDLGIDGLEPAARGDAARDRAAGDHRAARHGRPVVAGRGGGGDDRGPRRAGLRRVGRAQRPPDRPARRRDGRDRRHRRVPSTACSCSSRGSRACGGATSDDGGRRAACCRARAGGGHRFGEVDVLAGIDLEVRDGEFVALVGPSGCGKTTLLNLCSGWLTPTSRPRGSAGSAAHGLPAGRPVSVADGRRERAARPRATCRGPSERDGGPDALLGLIGLTRLRGALPAPAVGRHAAARGAGARARRATPTLLLMDEPFSSLDYLTRLKMRRRAGAAPARAAAHRGAGHARHRGGGAAGRPRARAVRAARAHSRRGRARRCRARATPRIRKSCSAVHRILAMLGLERRRRAGCRRRPP